MWSHATIDLNRWVEQFVTCVIVCCRFHIVIDKLTKQTKQEIHPNYNLLISVSLKAQPYEKIILLRLFHSNCEMISLSS